MQMIESILEILQLSGYKNTYILVPSFHEEAGPKKGNYNENYRSQNISNANEKSKLTAQWRNEEEEELNLHRQIPLEQAEFGTARSIAPSPTNFSS